MQANLIGVINILNRLSSSLRIGVVAYKDRGEGYLTRDFPLRPMESAEVGQILDFVRGLEASGGGDDPEPVDLALKVAIDMPWRADAQGRIVVIGDALARDRQAAFDLATRSGIRRSRRNCRGWYRRSMPATSPSRPSSSNRSQPPAAASTRSIRGRSSRACCCRSFPRKEPSRGKERCATGSTRRSRPECPETAKKRGFCFGVSGERQLHHCLVGQRNWTTASAR